MGKSILNVLLKGKAMRKKVISIMKLKEKSMPIDAHNWYYEETKGISFVHEVYREDCYLQTDIVIIPWKRLLESVRRKYNKEGKEI